MVCQDESWRTQVYCTCSKSTYECCGQVSKNFWPYNVFINVITCVQFLIRGVQHTNKNCTMLYFFLLELLVSLFVENKRLYKRKKELKTKICEYTIPKEMCDITLFLPSIFGSVYSTLVSHHDLLSVHTLIALFYFINMKANLSIVERNCSFEHGTGSSQVQTVKLLQ